MAHHDVKAALAHGIGLINAWKAGEEGKIAAVKAAAVANDGGVRGLSDELGRLALEEKKVPARFFGAQLVLRNAHGKNLRSLDSGKLEHHENKGGWEQWILEDSKKGDGSFYISNTALDFRLSAHDGKVEVKTTKNRDAWEQFKLEDAPGAPGKYMFRTFHGTHLSQTDTGVLRQSPNSAGWEFWELQFASGADPIATRRSETEAKLEGARKASNDAANAAEASQRAALEAEVNRRIAAKNEQARRIEGELGALAGP